MPALDTDGKPIAYTAAPDTMNGTQVLLGVGRQQRTVLGVGCWTAANANPTGVCGVGTCAPWTITPPTWSIQNDSSFAQWYHTTANVNLEIPGELMLTETPAGSGVSVYDSTAFFPHMDFGREGVVVRLARRVAEASAASLGVTVGSSYAMDILHAERQTTESNFRIETNIRCFEPVVVK